jgi:hypothetical protein
MTDKQREDHVQAKYWNGFITRVEAQNVFDEQTQVICRQAEALAKFDAAISCIAEKVGVTFADVNAWVADKVAAAQKAQDANNPDKGEKPAL